jgi:sugar lactone lactonase YvrE
MRLPVSILAALTLSTSPAIAAPAATPAAAPSAASAEVAATSGLRVAAESHRMIWNAVAVDRGRVFVAGPRWTGSKGPALGRLNSRGEPRPYPDAAWNSWRPGTDAARSFVNVNAIHKDGHGGLWVVDTGSPEFGGDPLPGGAKLVRIDLTTDRVSRVIPLGGDVALPGSYVDDIRFNSNGTHAYLTDAGRPGLIVLDLHRGTARRVLDGHPSVTAPDDRPIILSGQTVKAPDGTPLKVNSDPLEVSPDGRWLYYASLHGPWSRIPTRLLDDPSIPGDVLADKVKPWADLPPVGGTAMDRRGNLYFTDLAEDALKRRAPDGAITTLVRDPRLHWVDAPFIDGAGALWLPVPQMDRVALFQSGEPKTQWPVQLFRYRNRV